MRFVPAIVACWLALIPVMGASFSDDFTSAPNRWLAHNPGPIRWNQTNGNLSVTWDSRQTNSFFYFPLGTTLARSDSFSCEFTIRLNDLTVGINPEKFSTFPICVGFLDLEQAKRPAYFRGAGVRPANGPRSVVEFAYFPRETFDPTIGPIIASTNNQIAFSHTFPVELFLGETYRVKMSFDSTNQTLTTQIFHNGAPYGKPPANTIESLLYTESFGDFRIDAFSIHSFSDAGQFPETVDGSILAHGIIDDIVLAWPDPPQVQLSGSLTDGKWSATFAPIPGWTFALERSTNLAHWKAITNGAGPELLDISPPANGAFYRLQGTRP